MYVGEGRARLAVLDSNSLLNRAFYALPRLTTSQGEVTNAVYGFIMMLQRLLDEERPDYVIATFDKPAPTFRHAEYQEYKAHRKPMPDELRPQVPLMKEVFEAFGIPVMDMEGFEADDLIGTITRRAEEAQLESFIVTGDRDSLQLASDRTKIILTKKGITEVEVYDDAKVKERYGVTPEQFIDIKGLMGDQSDNIPGVPGVGEKTAMKLIAEYGSVEKLLEASGSFSGRIKDLLIEHADQARLSRRLATIERAVPVEFDPARLEPIRPDYQRLYKLFVRLEFRALAKKLAAEHPEVSSEPERASAGKPEGARKRGAKAAVADEGGPRQESLFGGGGGDAATGGPTGHDAARGTTIIAPGDAHTTAELIAACRKHKVFALQAWTTPVSAWTSVVRGVAVALPDASLHFVECSEENQENLAAFLVAAREEGLVRVGHDLKGLAAATGVMPTSRDFDVMLASYVLDPTRGNHSLEEVAFNYLGLSLPDKPAILATPASVADLAPVAGYFGARAAACLALYERLSALMQEREVEKLFADVEMPLAGVLLEVERRGVAVDVERLSAMSREMEQRINALTSEIFGTVGEEFNLNSPKQLATVLFDKLRLTPKKRTKTGFSTNAEVLEELAEENPIVGKILDYRQAVKLKTTYVDALPALINPASGRIHTTFNQAVTATGRLSSTNPNLQNIPIRSEEGGRIRAAFVAGQEGYSLLSADYSQIELRVLAHMSQDPVLCDSFLEGQDIHARTAAEIFGIPLAEVTPKMRSGAKAINFGIIYGISSFGLARGTGISRVEAQHFIERYFQRYAEVKAYLDRMIAEARDQGFVTTLLGRRRYLPDIHNKNYALRSFAERTAMNTPIQGSAADIIKLAMIACEARLAREGLATRMILQVHDELVFEGPTSEMPRVAAMVRSGMENAYPLAVPLDVDIEVGLNWREGKKV